MKEQLSDIISESRINELFSIGVNKTIRATDYFISAGEVPFKIAFLKSGLFRYVYVNDKGDEFTKGIIPENNILSSYSAMVLGNESYFSIEAMEESHLIEIQWVDFKQLLEKDVFWVKFLLKLVEKGFMIKEKRERDLLLLDAEMRYRDFLLEFPGMDQRIKQGVIASYLGIKPETLSRIRKKMVF